MKRTENTRVNTLSKKLGYEKKQKTENISIFRKNKKICPKQTIASFYDTYRKRSFYRQNKNGIR
jgi:hypothetical protein